MSQPQEQNGHNKQHPDGAIGNDDHSNVGAAPSCSSSNCGASFREGLKHIQAFRCHGQGDVIPKSLERHRFRMEERLAWCLELRTLRIF